MGSDCRGQATQNASPRKGRASWEDLVKAGEATDINVALKQMAEKTGLAVNEIRRRRIVPVTEPRLLPILPLVTLASRKKTNSKEALRRGGQRKWM